MTTGQAMSAGRRAGGNTEGRSGSIGWRVGVLCPLAARPRDDRASRGERWQWPRTGRTPPVGGDGPDGEACPPDGAFAPGNAPPAAPVAGSNTVAGNISVARIDSVAGSKTGAGSNTRDI